MNFLDTVKYCYSRKDLVEQFDRLYGTSLMSKGLAFEIDMATGKFEADARAFFDFVYDCVWEPLVEES